MTWPELLRCDDQTPVETADQWCSVRRPELLTHLQDSVYGPWPPPPEGFDVQALTCPRPTLDGAGTLRELEIVTTGPATSYRLLVVLPADARGPVPVFLGANFSGNHRVLADPAIALSAVPGFDGTSGEATRGQEAASWDVRATLAAGYGLATFCMSEVVPDDAARALGPLASFAAGRRTGAISAWAWAFSRALDVLGELPEVDTARVVAVGHSRLGKAALWAAAVDERFAAVIPSQSGCGGAAPSRIAPELAVIQPDGRPVAETVAVITTNFPHWFSPAYAAHADHVDDLPVDQDALIALCAPRPVLLPNAEDDHWADPAGQFAMLVRADPVYALVAGSGLEATSRPSVGESSLGRLGYALRPGGHSLAAEDWPVWREFTDRWVR